MQRRKKPQNPSQGHIRIISGNWRGRKLPVLNSEGLRPTTDRTKETLFNWLAPYIVGLNCLDAFSGTGSLGLEALSRGAATVTFIEKDKKVASQLTKNLDTLGAVKSDVKLIVGDALQLLANDNEQYDLIFLDPPFHQGLADEAMSIISSGEILSEDGLVYLETELSEKTASLANDWLPIKSKSTKTMNYQLLQRA